MRIGVECVEQCEFRYGQLRRQICRLARHADGVVITSPITRAMADAAHICCDAVPSPKIVIAFGACAVSGGIFAILI